jgi:hypothetical protein
LSQLHRRDCRRDTGERSRLAQAHEANGSGQDRGQCNARFCY